jgi:hypothetical protein
MRRHLQALEPRSQAGPGWHLSQDEILRLMYAPADDESVARLRDHLGQCGECVAEFKDAYAFYAPPAPQEAIPNEKELARAWQAFTPHLPQPRPAPQVVEAPRVSWWQSVFAPRLGWAVAGLLLLAAGVSLWWALRLRDEKKALANTYENDKARYIKALEDAKQNAPKPPATDAPAASGIKVIVPARGRNFSFTLNAPDLPELAEYRAELIDPAGKIAWSGKGLLRGKAGDFRFTFERWRVTSGDYKMRFYDPQGVEPLAVYNVLFRG